MAHNIVEKVVFSFGLIFFAALIGYLGYLMYKDRSHPPELHVISIYKPEMRNYGFQIEVKNMGEETATNAQIKLSLYQDGKAVESGTLNIDYVPTKSKETAWIVFKRKRKPTDSLVVSFDLHQAITLSRVIRSWSIKGKSACVPNGHVFYCGSIIYLVRNREKKN